MPTSLQDRALQLEQLLLAVEAAAIADELPVGTDHAVAWQDDRQRVPVHDRSDRTCGSRPCCTRREFAVGDDLAVRDARKLSQDAAVEVGEQCDVDRQVELLPLALEVLVELAPSRVD